MSFSASWRQILLFCGCSVVAVAGEKGSPRRVMLAGAPVEVRVKGVSIGRRCRDRRKLTGDASTGYMCFGCGKMVLALDCLFRSGDNVHMCLSSPLLGSVFREPVCIYSSYL